MYRHKFFYDFILHPSQNRFFMLQTSKLFRFHLILIRSSQAFIPEKIFNGHLPAPRLSFCLPVTVSQRLLHVNNSKRNPELTLPGDSDHLSLAVRFVNWCPKNVQPYLRLMRIDRPIGTWLVFLPCAWSISLATPAGQLPDPKTLLLFGLGSFFMRGAGCTINDMWDKDFDAKVERTKFRPLACNQLTRFKALCFLSVPLSVSFAILLTFNWNTVILGICSLVPCIIYPLAKRFTYWPQAFLGLTQGWGVLIAWSEICSSLTWPTLALYSSAVFWTMFYDTIYSHQDIEDDLNVGIKSAAIKLGDNTKYWLTGFGGVVIGGLTTTGVLCQQPWLYYVGVAGFAAHLAHQVWSVNLKDRNQCGEKFRSNRNLGLLFWGVIIASNLLKMKATNEEKDVDNKVQQKEILSN